MGRLIKETPYSEITATIERLDEFSVTPDGFKNIRTMSPALLKQLAYIVENGVNDYGRSVRGLPIFDVTLDSRNIDYVVGQMRERKIHQSMLTVDNMIKPCSALPLERKKFVVLTLPDFGFPDPYSIEKNLSSENWLREWSRRNLLGSHCIFPCERVDTALHIALVRAQNSKYPHRMVITNAERKKWSMVVDERIDKGYVDVGLRVDFSYNCPAVFELRQV